MAEKPQELPITLNCCDVGIEIDLDPSRSVVVVPKTMDGDLIERQLGDYKDQRAKFLS